MDAQPEHVRLLLGIRKLRHWTQEDLARELQVSARTIRRWENGESEPNARDLETFRRLLMYEESALPCSTDGRPRLWRNGVARNLDQVVPTHEP